MPFAIDPDFTTPDDPIDMAFRHTFAYLQQIIVETLPLFVLANNGLCDRFFAYFGHFEYTGCDLRLGLKEAMTRETVERRQFVDGTALSGRHHSPLLQRPVQDQTAQTPG